MIDGQVIFLHLVGLLGGDDDGGVGHGRELAARAAQHFHVSKEVRADETFTLCQPLDDAGRAAELKRMAGDE